MRILISSHLHRQIYRILVYYVEFGRGKSFRLKSEGELRPRDGSGKAEPCQRRTKVSDGNILRLEMFRNSTGDPPGTCSRRLSLRRFLLSSAFWCLTFLTARSLLYFRTKIVPCRCSALATPSASFIRLIDDRVSEASTPCSTKKCIACGNH
jgi:hypothetical protein